jgi:polysaccharide export outer membrane protein
MGRRLRLAPVLGILLLSVTAWGCVAHQHHEPPPVPHELAKVSLPPYVIEPPDILLIDAIRVIPRPPYRVEPLDVLGIRVTDTLPEQPIQGVYSVEADGRVNLGFSYGSVLVQGMTLEQARVTIERHLRGSLKPPYQVSVAMTESRALQLIRGPHLVQTDGTVSLGLYGSVYVDNMTIPQAKEAIESHLSQFLVDPEISLSVSGYNSKVFYVVTDGGGATGDQIYRLPMTGKLTVLDALGLVYGLPFQASKHHMWVARPAPDGSCEELVLPVDYKGIVQCGKTGTNYQLLPGDRLYVKAAPLITLDAYIARVVAPIDRVVGTNLLINSLISSYQGILNFHPTTASGVVTGTGTGVGIITPVGR